MDPKILLIDDSAILRRIAVNVLTTRAICGEVITATRATEGFARACAAGVGLVLVDYQIAGMPGADLCRRLLAEPRTSRVPVILLLGPGMTPPAKDSMPANIVDFLVKPFTPEQLVSTVRAAMGAAVHEAPVGRLREPAARPAGIAPGSPSDHHEIATVVNTTAQVRRETNRLQHTRAPLRQAAVPTPMAREAPRSRSLIVPTRLRAALKEAIQRQETGAFRVRASHGPVMELYLENGQIVVVATKDSKQYSEGADGVVPSKVRPATLDEAVSEQAQTGVPFFLALGARGLLSKAAATGLLHRFGQRHFARFWSEPVEALTFEFVTHDALPGFALRLEPHREAVDEWLLEASRYLVPEDIAALTRQEGYGGTPAFMEDRSPMPPTLRWSDRSAISAGRSDPSVT